MIQMLISRSFTVTCPRAIKQKMLSGLSDRQFSGKTFFFWPRLRLPIPFKIFLEIETTLSKFKRISREHQQQEQQKSITVQFPRLTSKTFSISAPAG